MNEIGTRIREERKARGLSQGALAERVGITQQGVASIENGNTRESAKLVQIAKELGVNYDWLTTGEGDKAPKGPPVPTGNEEDPRLKEGMVRLQLDQWVTMAQFIAIAKALDPDGDE